MESKETTAHAVIMEYSLSTAQAVKKNWELEAGSTVLKGAGWKQVRRKYVLSTSEWNSKIV